MHALQIRPATLSDLPRLTEIYNRYVIHTPVTFDIEPQTIEGRGAFFRDSRAVSNRGACFSLRGLGFAGTNPRKLKHAPLKTGG